MLSASCSAAGDELFRRLSAANVRRLSPIGCAVLVRLHALQTVSAQRHVLPHERPREREEALEQSCESDQSIASSELLDEAAACDCGRIDWASGELSVAELDAAVECVQRLALAADSVWLETVVMQVEFETLYALSSHCRDIDRQSGEAAQRRRVEELLAIDLRAAHSASQPSVVSFYSSLFQLCLHCPALSGECRADRRVQREVAAAVESVFPLSHLHEHALRDAAARRRELDGMSDLVLGIRLFNQQIGKGGARLQLTAAQVASDIAAHNSQLGQEGVFIGEIANTYTALLTHFHAHHGQAQSRQRREVEEKEQLAQHSGVGGGLSHGSGLQGSRTATATSAAASLTAFPSCLLDATRVHCELIHRRQYLLFLHALQSEGSASLSSVQAVSQQLDESFSQLTSIVGLRAAVPKHTVFPAFERVGRLYRQLVDEASKAELRQRLLSQLQDSRNPFITSLTTTHIRQCKELQHAAAQLSASGDVGEPAQADFDLFVLTVDDKHVAADNSTAAAVTFSHSATVGATATPTPSDTTSSSNSTVVSAAAGADSVSSDECVRVTASGSPSFMSVALAYQGYCCVTLVRHSGFLLAGDAALGVIRYRQTHFAFASIAAMKAFVQQPQRFIQQLQTVVAVHYPPLIHLLCLQNNIPHTDIALYITDKVVQAAHKHTKSAATAAATAVTIAAARKSLRPGAQQTRSGAAAFFPPLKQPTQPAATQTPTHFPTPTAASGEEGVGVGLQSLHWNEWEMRRRAVQMADLRHARTHTTQTDSSHFRRNNSSQYTLPGQQADGSVEARGTQTRVDKSTNSEHTAVYVAGLRSDPKQQSHITNVTLTLLPLVGEPTNPPLNGGTQ